MSVEVVILLLVIAVLVGAAVAYFTVAVPARMKVALTEQRIADMDAEIRNERTAREALAVEKATAAALAGRVPQLECTSSDLRMQLDSATKTATEMRANLETEWKTYSARVQELENMGAEIERNFAVLASEALGKNSENFLKLMSERFEKHKAAAEKDLEERQKAIELLVKPVSESLTKFEHKLGELETARVGAYFAITEQVKKLAEGQVGLRTETSRLVQALRQPKTRGRWGEYQLRNVLEMAGMTEHVDFIEEQTIEGDGGRLRPDVIVRLPGGKSVVIDAKTPLEAYLAALDTNDEETRERQMVDHARQVRDHVRTLASREYWKALPVTPDFVVMFVPGEAFFASAIESDPNLFEQAVRQRVLISTPTTLIALLKAIAYGWQQEKLAENAQTVASEARDLFDRIKVFSGYMRDLGRSLQQAVEQYNKGSGHSRRASFRQLEGLRISGSSRVDLRYLYSSQLRPMPAMFRRRNRAASFSSNFWN
jgi:DNA recombination protein RmuC